MTVVHTYFYDAYINYFQSCIIIFLQNHHALQYTSTNAALVFEICPKKNWCFVFETISSIFEPPYPASYCTYINTLITINGLHSSVNFNWRNFSVVKNSITARCLNRTSENSSIQMCNTQNGFYPDMSNVNRNITVEAKLINPLTYISEIQK